MNLKEIHGDWDAGWALDKHVLSSTYVGDNEWGHPQFDTQRSEVGEASFQLKYRSDWAQVPVLAQALAVNILPKISSVGFIVPMPASKVRDRQPVTEVARALGMLVQKPVFESLAKTPGGPSLKDLQTKQEKLDALTQRLSVVHHITNEGRWDVLLVDDLYDSGASMETACAALRGYEKVNKIYVAALTWK
ncbi:ComF family protein [Delftia acidovorans]|uniref:ComF family protein n=1 Tax=Delftia acidovorans TaxID=80866 RepID=UPI001E35B4F5|nr:ComF family protein [Delftia acidovorans]